MTVIRTHEQPPRLMAASGRPAVRAPGGAGPHAGLTSKDVLRILRKRLWLILAVLAVCLAVTVAVTIVWLLVWPRYTTASTIEVSPPESLLLQLSRGTYISKDIIERYQRNQALQIKTVPLLDLALREDTMKRTPWYNRHQGQDLVTLLQEEVDVTVVPNTSYIRVSMAGTDKDSIADVVNTVSRVFVAESAKGEGGKTSKQILQITGQRDRLRTRRDYLGTELAAQVGGSAIAALDAKRSTVAMKLQTFTQQATEAEIAQGAADAAMQSHRKEVQDGTIVNNPQVLMALDMDQTLRTFVYQLSDLKTRLDTAVRKFGPKHRTVANLQGLVTALEAQTEARRAEVVKTQIESLGQFRAGNLAIATQQLVDLRDRLRQVSADARDLENTLGRINKLQQESLDVEAQIRLLDNTLLQLQTGQTGEAGGDTQSGPARMVTEAPFPREVYQPRWSTMMVIGTLLGLLLGVGLAFLLELGDTSVRTPSDVLRRVDLPLLGMVPHADDMDEDIDDFRRVTLIAPHSPAAEAFRQIRTNLLFSGPAQHRRSILVTSPNPEDGRTTVVINLAIAMAQAGRRVLVVDANFRQPAIASIVPDTAAAGLSSALVGQASWKDVVSPSGVANLDVIAAGPLPPNPAELLGSDMMRQLLAEMTAEYDQVILDGSPVMVVSDACVLSTQVDGTILVVRAGSNSVGIVQRASEQLSRIGAHVLGIVLQGVRSTAGGYLRKNYQAFYDYQQQQEQKPRSLP